MKFFLQLLLVLLTLTESLSSGRLEDMEAEFFTLEENAETRTHIQRYKLSAFNCQRKKALRRSKEELEQTKAAIDIALHHIAGNMDHIFKMRWTTQTLNPPYVSPDHIIGHYSHTYNHQEEREILGSEQNKSATIKVPSYFYLTIKSKLGRRRTARAITPVNDFEEMAALLKTWSSYSHTDLENFGTMRNFLSTLSSAERKFRPYREERKLNLWGHPTRSHEYETVRYRDSVDDKYSSWYSRRYNDDIVIGNYGLISRQSALSERNAPQDAVYQREKNIRARKQQEEKSRRQAAKNQQREAENQQWLREEERRRQEELNKSPEQKRYEAQQQLYGAIWSSVRARLPHPGFTDMNETYYNSTQSTKSKWKCLSCNTQIKLYWSVCNGKNWEEEYQRSVLGHVESCSMYQCLISAQADREYRLQGF